MFLQASNIHIHTYTLYKFYSCTKLHTCKSKQECTIYLSYQVSLFFLCMQYFKIQSILIYMCIRLWAFNSKSNIRASVREVWINELYFFCIFSSFETLKQELKTHKFVMQIWGWVYETRQPFQLQPKANGLITSLTQVGGFLSMRKIILKSFI